MKANRLRLIVADDEDAARALVRRYTRQHADVRVVGECADGDALARLIDRAPADVALLDVRMPGASVFDVLDEAARRGVRLPWLIFATAYDAYAVRAFELNAVDYLLKPFTEARFVEALARARGRLGVPSGRQPTAPPPPAAAEADGLRRLFNDLGPRPDRLLVPDRDRMVPIAIRDIVWIKAEGDYARLHTAGASYLVTRTLTDLETRLDPAQFLRIHRSAMVRADRIVEVRREDSSRFRVILQDGTALIVSRTRALDLRRWIL